MGSESAQRQDEPVEERLFCRCPECNRKLCEKVGGKYVAMARRTSRDIHHAEIVVGSITCPKCGWVLQIPWSAFNAPNLMEA